MEIAAFAGLLGLGYFANQKKPQKTTEGYTNAPAISNIPAAANIQAAASQYDMQFNLMTGGSMPAEPNPSLNQGGLLHMPINVPSTSLPTQHALSSQAILQMRPDKFEDTTPRPGGFVSQLSGVEFQNGEFKHSNMVPFFRGQLKQNTIDTANNQILDAYTGSGKIMYAKREQTPFFEPTKEPMGNPHGLESTTDFMASRIVESSNRANEKPIESVRVGPGLNAGYTHLPSGGFQQTAGEEYLLERMPRTNDLRTANNPKLSYDAPVVPGAHYNAAASTPESIGAVFKYNADKFYLNENGERNFVTVGADTKPAMIATQVLKNTVRPETTRSYEGVAALAEGKATYTVGSARAPLVKQMGDWGFRNADLTDKFNPDTDAEENDYGRSGIVFLPNERSLTGERVHATNLKPDKREGASQLQDAAKHTRAQDLIDNNWIGSASHSVKKLTVYDPNNIAKTTIRETTEDGDYIGISTGPNKLTVYDPNDPLRTTIRETTEDSDYIGISTGPHKLTVYDPNNVARTTIKETTEYNNYRGVIAVAEKHTVYDPNDVARTTIRETTENNNYRGITKGPNKLTVYDPNDKMRTTIRETTEDSDYIGITAGPNKLTVYDPNDKMRTTVKETTEDNDYIGITAGPNKLTVYDPNDKMRTTVRETTEDNDYLGISAPANVAQKLTVYDPDDIAKLTLRNTLKDWDMYRNMGRQDLPQNATIRIQDGVRMTQKAGISAKSDYTGIAGTANAKAETNRQAAKAMRHYAQKEKIATGRAPTSSSVKIFNGEDWINQTYRRLVQDSINDREMGADRVTAEPMTTAVIGIQRPRAALKTDMAAERMEPASISSLENNPYVIPLHKVTTR